ncbi:MAG: F0F1 ATP synthase subunit B [Actinomycetota bacterium]
MSSMILAAGGEEIESFRIDDENNVVVTVNGEEELLDEILPLSIPEENNPILPETKEVIWGGLAFFILVALLAKFAFPAVKQTMDDRAAKIQGDLEAAETAKEDAERIQREYEASLANAKAESNRIIEEARAQAEALRAERVAALDTELAERRAAAAADIEAAKAQATADLRGQIAELAIGAAERVVGQNLDPATNSQIVEDYISSVASS